MTAQEVLLTNTPVTESLIKVLPFIDPDSSRMVEWIWATRQAAGKSTYSEVFTLPRKAKASLKDIADTVKENFEHFYSSLHLFRGLRVDVVGNTSVVGFYAVLESTSNGITLNLFGDEAEVGALINTLKTKFVEPKSILVETLLGFTPQGPVIDKAEITEIDQYFSKDEFYPWLAEGIDNFVASYLKSKASVILLIGEPGTGKSTFLRTLMFKLNREKHGLVSNEQALIDPGLVGWLKDIGSDAVIGVEDADNLVGARADGNRQMSMLLNYADGVVSTNTKFIISTNLSSLNKVDEALLRRGRAFRVLHFRKLSALEANAARVSIGLDTVEYDEKESFTLSDALNYDNVNDGSRLKRGVGF